MLTGYYQCNKPNKNDLNLNSTFVSCLLRSWYPFVPLDSPNLALINLRLWIPPLHKHIANCLSPTYLYILALYIWTLQLSAFVSCFYWAAINGSLILKAPPLPSSKSSTIIILSPDLWLYSITPLIPLLNHPVCDCVIGRNQDSYGNCSIRVHSLSYPWAAGTLHHPLTAADCTATTSTSCHQDHEDTVNKIWNY